MSFEKPPQEPKVELKSLEKKSQMWQTLRIAALGGLLIFGGQKAVEKVGDLMSENQHSQQRQEEVEKRFKKEFGREMTQEDKDRWEDWGNKFGGMKSQERDAIIINSLHNKGARVEDGKIIQETSMIMDNGKVYLAKTEIDATNSPLIDPATGDLRVGELSSATGGQWDKAFVSTTEKDGSGLKVVYEATKDGLKIVTQELGGGGKVLSEKVSMLQEVK